MLFDVLDILYVVVWVIEFVPSIQILSKSIIIIIHLKHPERLNLDPFASHKDHEHVKALELISSFFALGYHPIASLLMMLILHCHSSKTGARLLPDRQI